MLPPAGHLYILPHSPPQRGLCLAPGEEVVTRLPLFAATPPTQIRVDLLDLVAKLRPDRFVSGQKLVVAAGHLFAHSPELLSLEPGPGGRSVAPSALMWLAIYSAVVRVLVSVETLAMCERLVS